MSATTSVSSFIINGVTYYTPENVNEVLALVNQAALDQKVIAVRGSAHSFPLVKTNENYGKYLYIILAKMNKIIAFDKINGIIQVEAGIHLGLDPKDPLEISTLENSLNYQIDPFDLKTGKRNQPPGWALPDLGGITHQTVGGFTATGSAGGNTSRSFENALISVDMVQYDGTSAKVVTYNRPKNGDPDDPFFGVAFANLGLMGLMVSATFQLIPAFNVSGNEATTQISDCAVDIFGDGSPGRPSMQDFLMKKDLYTRIMYWPQSNIEKLVIWSATPADASDWQTYTSKPYHEVPYIAGSPTLAEMAAGFVFRAIGNWPRWIEEAFGLSTDTYEAILAIAKKLDPIFLKLVLGVFAKTGDAPQEFHDVWWNGIPMDNSMSDSLFPVEFTELWIPIDKSKEVMNTLRTMTMDPEVAGNFSIEIYGSGSNEFWLSPGYGTDVIRVDVFWFAANEIGNIIDFYTPYWKELQQYNYRCHWAKYMPSLDIHPIDNYPKMDNWKVLRQSVDPNDIFLSEYWKTYGF